MFDVSHIQKFFIENNLTLAVAESLTGGNIQALLTSISGSSAYFSGGITAYNIRQKVDILGVTESIAEKCNCVSVTVAEEMAAGVAELMGTDFGVATTGYVSPDPENGIQKAHAYISVYRFSDNSFHSFLLENEKYQDRPSSQMFFAENALEALSNYLKD